MMKVGYSRIDITPTESVPLAGYGNTSGRMSQNILSHLFSTCIALTDDEGTTALMFHNDLISTVATIFDPIRTAISEATGVPFEHITVSATHSHSVPDLTNEAEPSILRYRVTLKDAMVECAKAAMADRKEATASLAKTHTKGVNFVRHYVLEDGTYKGDNFGNLNNSPYAGHTTEVDTEMRLIKFHREGAETVLMVSWQTHPHRTGGFKKYDVCADIVGAMRDAMEEAIGCKFIYFTGGGGNVNPSSRIPEENITKDYLEQGQLMAKYALSVEDAYEPIELDKVKVCTKILWTKLNRPNAAMVENARKVREYWVKTNDYPSSVELAESFGMNSPYAAMALLRKHETEVDGYNVPFTAISFGDLAFVTAPYEMFDTNAKYVREASPFKVTVVSSCTNDAHSYVPSAYGYIHGCYETDCARYAPGTGERFAYNMVRMLEGLKA